MYKIFCFAILLLLGVACQKEGNLMPSNGIENYFEIPEDATDAESVLRREFQKETGCYLLFNDTLRKELLGRDVDGFPIYSFETVDLGYGVTASSMDKFVFRYLSTLESKKTVVNFVKESILSLMEKEVYPYSFLLVDTVFKVDFMLEEGEEVSEGWYSKKLPIDYYSGTRCLALSVGRISEMDNEERGVFVTGIFKGMITNSLALKTSELKAFYAPGEKYYGKRGDTWEFDGYFEDLRELGFITGYFEYDYVEFPTKDEDLRAYVDVLFGDEEEFLTENESFPLVIQKYNIVKKVVQSLGYHLELINK